jgi:DNA repair protein RadC
MLAGALGHPEAPFLSTLEDFPMYVSDIRKVRYRGRESPVIGGAEDVYRLLRRRLSGRDREHFVVLLLSSRHAVLAIETVSVGSLNASIVHPREVLKPAILASAAGIIVAHNHPSGDPTPSADDVEITKRLARAADIMGIPLLDHVIVGSGGRFESLKARGIL